MGRRVNYRRLAFDRYPPVCAHCGFGIAAVLEVAHIDGDRWNNELTNLVILCPNCHKMHDLDIISSTTIREMRDRPKTINWRKRMKNAGHKAAATRKSRATALRRKRRLAALKAAATRRRNRRLLK
jgi:5-methylcytosine-specific restriction endonuclease McrA